MTGSLYVISAPSGAGKSSVIKILLERRKCPNLDYSVSFTTRQPRPGEVNGRDYFFVDEMTFRDMLVTGGFLEWAKVFSNYYGTGRDWVNQRLATGRDVLVDVDVVGAKSLRVSFPQAVMIFMVPPSQDELSRRLTARQTETPEELEKRLAESALEITQRTIFDYLVINDELNRAVEEVEGILRGQPGRRIADEEDFWPKYFQKSH
jgi:guanylate kinase